MITVTMTRDLRPWRKGDSATVADALAAQMIEKGEAKDPRPFPPPDVAPGSGAPSQAPVDQKPVLSRPRDYFTRDRKAEKPTGGKRR